MHTIYVALLVCALQFVRSDIVYRLIGGVTTNSFNIKTKTTDASAVTLYINNVVRGTYTADSTGYYNITVTDLTPGTTYLVDLGVNNVRVVNNTAVTTFSAPTQNRNLTFTVGANIKYGTSSAVFNRIKSLNPDFMMVLGDIHDQQIKSTNFADHEKIFIASNSYSNLSVPK